MNDVQLGIGQTRSIKCFAESLRALNVMKDIKFIIGIELELNTAGALKCGLSA